MIIKYLTRVAAWFSQTANLFLLLGHHDQTVSARCFVNRNKPVWKQGYKIINFVFFWQDDHCLDSYLRDVEFAKEVLEV